MFGAKLRELKVTLYSFCRDPIAIGCSMYIYILPETVKIVGKAVCVREDVGFRAARIKDIKDIEVN